MIARADLSVEAADGSTLAIIEVKNREHLTAELAADLRRNLLAHGLASTAQYFLIVSQDHAYLWRTGTFPDPDPGSPPDVHWPMAEIVEHYYPGRAAQGRLYNEVLEWIVILWINDLSIDSATIPDIVRQPLEHSGFLSAVRGAIALPEVSR
jgi:hypothetical protein